jgi:protein-disulfide isomerase
MEHQNHNESHGGGNNSHHSGSAGHHTAHKKGFFDAISSKTAFGLGAASSVLGLCSVGFIVLLVVGFGGFAGNGSAAPVNAAVDQKIAAADTGNAPIPTPPPPAAANVPEVTDADHFRGPKDAAVTIVEYSDFECPFCSRFHETMKQVRSAFPDDVKWVYRHYPLDQLHPNARAAAEASECVADIGGNDKFWEFADKVFAGGAPATPDKLKGYVGEIGVNVTQFEKCVADGKFRADVNDEAAGGSAAGVRGTPGNFLIEKDGSTSEIPGAQPFNVIEPVIKQILGQS